MKKIFRTAILASLLISTFAEAGAERTPLDWATTENCKFAWDYSGVETDVYQALPAEYQSQASVSKKIEGHCELISIQGNNPEGNGTCSVVAKCFDTSKKSTDPSRWVMNEFTTNVSGSLSYIKADERGRIYGYK